MKEINEAWKSTCRIVLGEEIGEMDDYKSYLCKYLGNGTLEKSALSGKPVSIDSKFISNGAKFMSHDEIKEYEGVVARKQISLDDMKDLDSLAYASSELIYYTGNVVLGNSKNVTGSNRCANSFFVHGSHEVYDSKYVAYSISVRSGEYIFGCTDAGDCRFNIANYDPYKGTREFECLRAYTSSDCYYSANLDGCSNCMFSFNQRSKRNMIGNTQFESSEYDRLKAKLLEDIRSVLEQKKAAPGIIELING